MIYVSRKEHFNAAHKLHNPNWSLEKNAEVFGPCANENWHGHNFELIVTVRGRPHPDTGFVVDMKKLSNVIEEKILDKVDHKNLNVDVDFMQGKMPSCEILVEEFWKILAPEIHKMAPQAALYAIRLYETPKNYVEFFGEGPPRPDTLHLSQPEKTAILNPNF
jgi:6-pyruvoyltetrahydropterin/6-carboxytetrahydropterin synthase